MAEVREPKQKGANQGQARTQQSREKPQEQQVTIQSQSREPSGTQREHAPQTTNRMLTPFEEMDRFMDRIFEGFAPRSWLRSLGLDRHPLSEMAQPFDLRTPKVDVVNRDDDILIRAEIPGVDKDNLQVSVTENTVTIRGECRREETSGEGDYFRQEISQGTFSRTLALPSEVDGSKAKANFRNGLLELNLPKVEKAKRHTVNID